MAYAIPQVRRRRNPGADPEAGEGSAEEPRVPRRFQVSARQRADSHDRLFARNFDLEAAPRDFSQQAVSANQERELLPAPENSNGAYGFLGEYSQNYSEQEEPQNLEPQIHPEAAEEQEERVRSPPGTPIHHEPILRPRDAGPAARNSCFLCDFEDLLLPQEIQPILETLVESAYQRLWTTSPNRVAQFLERAIKEVLVPMLVENNIDMERDFGLKPPSWRSISLHLHKHGQNAIVDYVVTYRMVREQFYNLYNHMQYQMENLDEDEDEENAEHEVPQVDRGLLHEWNMMVPKMFALMQFNPLKSLLVPTRAGADAANQTPVINAASATLIGAMPKFLAPDQQKVSEAANRVKRKTQDDRMPEFLRPAKRKKPN